MFGTHLRDRDNSEVVEKIFRKLLPFKNPNKIGIYYKYLFRC